MTNPLGSAAASKKGAALGYDLIGDIHGCGRTLVRLLEKLGYARQGGCYRHPSRKAIFVGDIIDRGPRIREALSTVRAMHEAGEAYVIMGNHEYNALSYCTTDDSGPEKRYLRKRTPRNDRLIKETLEQFALHPLEWQSYLDWFMALPLLLDFGHFRVVHACWDSELIAAFLQRYPDARIDLDFLKASADTASYEHKVMDRLTRGTDLQLPDGVRIAGGDGFVRDFFRTKYWATDPQTYGDVVFQPDALPDVVEDRPLAPEEQEQLVYYGPDEPMLFMGHYWLTGKPRRIRRNICCLDYSAVKYGKLVAYRLDDEREIREDKFVWVDVGKESQW